jgi:hypothetical protein
MAEPRELVEQLERDAVLPPSDDERFSGYGVMACPFSSGDVLCHRRFPASSVGPAYTSVWHRTPDGPWKFYQDVAAHKACTRFFGSAVSGIVEAPIAIDWTGPRSLHIAVERALNWELTLASTPVTRAMNAIGGVMPDALSRNSVVLKTMGSIAGMSLGAGKLALTGRAPNGQWFVANPLLIWKIVDGRATLDGLDLRAVISTSTREQARLGDFWIPRTGLLAIGRAFFEPFDEARHVGGLGMATD